MLGLLLILALASASLEGLGAEFRALRQVQGYFGGGEWCDDVDRWGGRKHVVMTELGEALGVPGTSAERVVSVMGPPDERAAPGDLLWELAGPADGTALLVYHWRGRHDFLYFACEEGRVLASGWWMAGE